MAGLSKRHEQKFYIFRFNIPGPSSRLIATADASLAVAESRVETLPRASRANGASGGFHQQASEPVSTALEIWILWRPKVSTQQLESAHLGGLGAEQAACAEGCRRDELRSGRGCREL
jgi:hypothetical protein